MAPKQEAPIAEGSPARDKQDDSYGAELGTTPALTAFAPPAPVVNTGGLPLTEAERRMSQLS